jgi:hypothetical protein
MTTQGDEGSLSMFKQKTVFVIGAGASMEFNMPRAGSDRARVPLRASRGARHSPRNGGTMAFPLTETGVSTELGPS